MQTWVGLEYNIVNRRSQDIIQHSLEVGCSDVRGGQWVLYQLGVGYKDVGGGQRLEVGVVIGEIQCRLGVEVMGGYIKGVGV